VERYGVAWLSVIAWPHGSKSTAAACRFAAVGPAGKRSPLTEQQQSNAHAGSATSSAYVYS